jgi:lipopolysaccharide transport protein LptA
MKIRLWCAALVMVLLLPLAAFAADNRPAEKQAPEKQGPETGLVPQMESIEEFRLVHADSMTLTRQKSKPQVFKGAVDIVLLDKAGNETGIKADKITVYYEQDLRKLDKIEAEGHVVITRLGTVATTELAVYRGDQNTIELLVDPHVKDSRGELNANKITIHLDSNEVVATGNVKGFLRPESFEKVTAK